MKRINIVILIISLLFLLSGCDKKESVINNEKSTITEQQDQYSENYDYVCVDIQGDCGYYTTMSNVTVDYCDDKILNILVNNPTLLAFQIPDEYESGIGIIEGCEISEISDLINDFITDNELDDETLNLLKDVNKRISNIPIFTSAST